jgi:hypothetical protein
MGEFGCFARPACLPILPQSSVLNQKLEVSRNKLFILNTQVLKGEITYKFATLMASSLSLSWLSESTT